MILACLIQAESHNGQGLESQLVLRFGVRSGHLAWGLLRNCTGALSCNESYQLVRPNLDLYRASQDLG